MHRIHRLPIALIALGLAVGCSSGSTDYSGNPSPPPPPPAAQANDIKVVQGASTKGTGAFDPNPKSVSLGGGATVSVRWVNYDAGGGSYGADVTHRIVSDDGTSFDTGDIAANGAVSKSLAKGSYAYHCSIHPAMKGQLDVTD